MSNIVGKIGVLAAGALAMYFLDPQLGAQRRAAVAELLAGRLPGARRRVAPLPHRLARRVYHRPAKADPQSDAELRDRIRNRLGRLVSFPGAVQVSVEDGVVRLSGDVLSKERDGLLLQVQAMEGVQKLVNATTAHDDPAAVGKPPRRDEPQPADGPGPRLAA